jgi:hypothetical protein
MSVRERARLKVQEELDSQKTAVERNRWGQFATPPSLAAEIVDYTARLAGSLPADGSVLEPSCGTGSFLTALSECPQTSGLNRVGVELDPLFVDAAKQLWRGDAVIVNADFLRWVEEPGILFDLLVANPPYVRHHHVDASKKARYGTLAARVSGQRPSGLSGLYVYFMLTAAARLKPGAVASWLVPAEFMSVNYGSSVRRYLATRVTLERVHVFRTDDVQFDDALVTSCVVTYRNTPPRPDHKVRFSFGESFAKPARTSRILASELQCQDKWLQRFIEPMNDGGTVVGECFTIRRGIATGGNSFFIRPRSEFHELGIPDVFLRPVLPSPRNMPITEIQADVEGWPTNVARLALLDCTGRAYEQMPQGVRKYLDDAPKSIRGSYLARSRSPWYAQEQREASPIVCTYMGRAKQGRASAFRFIRNRSRAIATNSYLMLFPKPSSGISDWLDDAWIKLSQVAPSSMRAQGREYGGGLSKIEPRELARVVIPDLNSGESPALF